MQYGSYQHRQDSTGITISAQMIENENGLPYEANVDVNLEGKLRNARLDDATRLDPIIREMEAAYSIPGQDFGLLHDNGLPSAAFWRNSQTIGGIRPKLISYPNYRGGEYVTYRQFQIAVSMTLPVGPTPQYTRFNETISIEGGGPLYGVKEVNFGEGVRQRLRTHTKCIAVQSGTAVSRFQHPEIPPPIWPFALKTVPKISKVIRPRGSARMRNVVLNECEITWSYEFEWPTRLDGVPHYLIG